MPKLQVNGHLHSPVTRSSFLSFSSSDLWSHFLVLLFIFKSRMKAARFGINAALQALGIKVCCGFPSDSFPCCLCACYVKQEKEGGL